jgi:hypothetical protein
LRQFGHPGRLRAAIAIRRDHPATGVLVFSQYIETRYAADLLLES